MLVLVILIGMQMYYAADAYLTGNSLRVKKFLGTEYEFTLDNIEKVSSFKMRSTIYSIVRFQDNLGNSNRVLIINMYSFLLGREVPAHEILELLRSRS